MSKIYEDAQGSVKTKNAVDALVMGTYKFDDGEIDETQHQELQQAVSTEFRNQFAVIQALIEADYKEQLEVIKGELQPQINASIAEITALKESNIDLERRIKDCEDAKAALQTRLTECDAAKAALMAENEDINTKLLECNRDKEGINATLQATELKARECLQREQLAQQAAIDRAAKRGNTPSLGAAEFAVKGAANQLDAGQGAAAAAVAAAAARANGKGAAVEGPNAVENVTLPPAAVTVKEPSITDSDEEWKQFIWSQRKGEPINSTSAEIKKVIQKGEGGSDARSRKINAGRALLLAPGGLTGLSGGKFQKNSKKYKKYKKVTKRRKIK